VVVKLSVLSKRKKRGFALREKLREGMREL